MPDLISLEAMLNIVTANTASTVIYVDAQGTIDFVRSAKRPEEILRRYQGKNITNLLGRILGPTAEVICAALTDCSISGAQSQLFRVRHETIRNMTEFFDWSFAPAPTRGDVIIYIKYVSEQVCIEQEFAAISEQNEATTRELHAAMSNLDFRLMDLDQAHKKLAALYRITSIVQRTVNEQEVLDELVLGIVTEFGFPATAIVLCDEQRRELVVKAHHGYGDYTRQAYGQGVIWRAIRSRKMVYIPEIAKEPEYIPHGNQPGESEVVIPLIFAEKVIGVLDIESSVDRPIQPYDLDLLRSLAGQIALTIVHAQHVAKVQVEAITDALTGLYNYRHFLNILDREFKRALRYKRPLSLLMLDIDRFKNYNDTYGHPMGNELLCEMTEVIKSTCRDVDSVARYGGEEFVVLLPAEAFVFAERIRLAIAGHYFPGRHTQPGGAVTVSIGVAGYPEDSIADKELLGHADTALYLAKRSTRNCTVVFPRLAGDI